MSALIRKIRIERLELPFVRPFQNAKVRYETLSYLRVELQADDLRGLGEITAMPGYSSETLASMEEALNRHYGPAIQGIDLFAESEIEAAIDRALPGNPYARAALEMALWDARGRFLGIPVHALIGGAVRTEVPIAAIIPLDAPPAMAANARTWFKRGARTFQVKISKDVETSVARVRAVRAAVGRDSTIAVDGNGSFDRPTARRVMTAIASFDIAFFEQPVAASDIAGMAELVRIDSIPVVADECLVTAHDALRLVEARAAQGFNLKLAKSGIAETRRIMAIADAAGIPYGLGSMLETNFGTFAGIHMAATIRNPFFPAELVGPWMVRDKVSKVKPKLAARQLAWKVPMGPGWGVQPDTGV